jgi:hypothetical protein
MQVDTIVKIYLVQKENFRFHLGGTNIFFRQMTISVYSITNATLLIYFVLMIIHPPSACILDPKYFSGRKMRENWRKWAT